MDNLLTHIKDGQLFLFRYEIGSDEDTVKQSVVEYISKGLLDCFDSAIINSKMEEAWEKCYG